MTLEAAIKRAIANSDVVPYAVVKATKGELAKGYYVEGYTEAIPKAQLVAVYTAGRRSLPSLESDLHS